MPPDTDMTQALHVSEGMIMPLESWGDRAPFRPPIGLWHESSSHLPLLSSKKEGFKSRQMRTFLRYKHDFLNFNKGGHHLIPETLLFAISVAFTSSLTPIHVILLTTVYCIYYHWNITLITLLLTWSSEFIWQVPYRCHPPIYLGNTCR